LKAWSSARFTVDLPPGHRFPIGKYAMVRDGAVARGVFDRSQVHEPEAVDRWALELVHSRSYVDALFEGRLTLPETRRLGFPWSEQLRERSLHTVQATIEAARDAMNSGAGVTLAGGTHHAFADHGEGFCVFNDVAVAIRVLQREGRVRRAAIVDLDVHQGNGTARIFAGDPDVFTFSMHGAGTAHLDDVIATARPELVFYLAGADPYREDRFGRLAMSVDGLRARDARVFDCCRRHALPVVVTMAGGYARALEDVVTIHTNTLTELRRVYG
jgi:acetoin utilization deacetylase AcuC-like enzyme